METRKEAVSFIHLSCDSIVVSTQYGENISDAS